VDVSHLNIGDSVHVRDLSVPNVVILTESGATVATVVPPTVMEEKPAEEVAVAEGAPAEPEVITKGKKEEEGEGEGAKGEAKGEKKGEAKAEKKDDKREEKKEKKEKK
jgi:large subunit ribosomal protein L25